ncbi:hypothetical protein A3D14_00060 [Candidatus Saccharibacteria bacterium RIFCSPHIGHO2_02_FULL_47_12]|nr:MAG: hypothetical protein A3D14_00060 [Candidatus Saccharibacteria bacterium RIFCSPHIGHO2_02_FULL_47_12]
MRIIAGKLGGRQFDAPKGHRTHPMSEKARGGLFNALGDVVGLTVLDAFAGSGALAFEAISRGARHVTAIDIDKNAITSVGSSSRELGIEEQIKAIRAKSGSWSENNPDALFDLVLLDPPYDQIRPLQLEKLADHTKLSGIVVFSLPPKTDFALPTSNFQLLTSKSYGDALLAFYRKVS